MIFGRQSAPPAPLHHIPLDLHIHFHHKRETFLSPDLVTPLRTQCGYPPGGGGGAPRSFPKNFPEISRIVL